MDISTARANLAILNQNPKANLDVKKGKLIQIPKSNYLGRLSKFFRNLDHSVSDKVNQAIVDSLKEVASKEKSATDLIERIREARPQLEGLFYDFEQKSLEVPERKVNISVGDMEELFGSTGQFKRVTKEAIDVLEIKLNAMGPENKKSILHEYLAKNLERPERTDDFLRCMVSLRQNPSLFQAFKEEINKLRGPQESLIEIKEYINHPDNQP